MSKFKMFFGVATFAGDWDSVTTYEKNDVVAYTDKIAYKCIADTSLNEAPDVSTSSWELYLPLDDNANTIGVDTVTRISDYTFGDQGGTHTVQWMGQEWQLEKNGDIVVLVKVVAHCECAVCQCNCVCMCVQCVCGACNCADTCPPNYYHDDYCTGFLDPNNCLCQCECSAPACVCTIGNCTPGQEQCQCPRCAPCP